MPSSLEKDKMTASCKNSNKYCVEGGIYFPDEQL